MTSDFSTVINLFQAPEERTAAAKFDPWEMATDYAKGNTDWSVPEAFLCLLLSAVSADGVFAREEQEEVKALLMRSRALKSLNQTQLAHANAAIQKRLADRRTGLDEACNTLPKDMRLCVFAHCVDIILSDGSLVRQEAEYLNRIVGLLGLEQAEAHKVMEVLLVKNKY